MGKSFLFISGKGGVGKSTLSSAIAVAAAEQGRRVALIDGDLGLRSLDMMLGLQDKVLYDLSDVVAHTCPLDKAMVWHPSHPTLRLLVGGQGAKPKDFRKQDLLKILTTLKKRFDLVLVDGPAGLGRGVRNFTGITDEVVIISTPDPVAQRAAEKLASLLFQSGIRPFLLLNRINRDLVISGGLPQPGAQALSLDLPLLGAVEEGNTVYSAMLEGKTAYESDDAMIRNAVEDVLKRMQGMNTPVEDILPPRLNLFQRIWKWLED